MWSPFFFQFHTVWQVSSALETFVQMNMTWFDCNLISNMSLLWIKLWSLLIRSQLLYASWKKMSKISDFWIQKYHCLIRLYLTMTGSFNRPTNADWNVFYGQITSKNTFLASFLQKMKIILWNLDTSYRYKPPSTTNIRKIGAVLLTWE